MILMELKGLLQILNSHRILLFLGALIFGVVALGISTQIPPRREARLDLYVKRAVQDPSEEFYTYDGYYSQQVAERYTDTVVGLLQSKTLLKAALSEKELPTDQDTLRKMAKRVGVEKVAPQLIRVTVQKRLPGPFEWNPDDLSVSLAHKVVQRVEELNAQSGDDALSVVILGEEPISEEHEPFLFLNSLVGALFGLLGAFLVAIFCDYLES